MDLLPGRVLATDADGQLSWTADTDTDTHFSGTGSSPSILR